jgi:dienelactone hydrolase
MSCPPRLRFRLTWLVVMLAVSAARAADPPRVAGPDSDPMAASVEARYPHASMRAQQLGDGPRSYWLFEPTEPVPERAPVVVFNHGWLAVNPGVYGAWIEHLARRGFVVIFPRYQADWTTTPAEFLPNATAAVLDALDVLETAPGRVRPDRDRFALIGHSAGGNLAALMAASASIAGLPKPRAVLAIMPGEVMHLPEPRPATIPAETLLVVVAGDQDRVVGDFRARQIFAEATAVPAERKAYVLYRTDRRGPVPIIADHLAPTAGLKRLDSGEGPLRAYQFSHAEVDLLDRFGFWRLADLTLDAAFTGLSLAEATAEGKLIRDLGRWSNGLVVTPPVVDADLGAVPRVFPSNGARLIPWQPAELLRQPGPEVGEPEPIAQRP